MLSIPSCLLFMLFAADPISSSHTGSQPYDIYTLFLLVCNTLFDTRFCLMNLTLLYDMIDTKVETA